jgi:Rrf2 family protein
MQIPRRVDYGLRAVIFLSEKQQGHCCSIAEIAKHQGVPRKFLEKIFQDLLRKGLIKSKRGVAGGYMLARPAETITFYQVIEALEGPIAVNACMDEHPSCDQLPRCTMVGVWTQVQQKVVEIFTQTTLADLRQKPCREFLHSSLTDAA